MDWLLLGALGLVLAGWLCVLAMARPRLLLYLTLAVAPTQYLFIPVSNFFVSPADVLVCASALALLIRLATLQRATWFAVYQHRFVWLMLGSYLIGFAILGAFSRTIIRIPLAVTVSVVAAELLHTRKQLAIAATALVVAGGLDAAYGVFFILRGTPLHPSRFSGMSDVNFAAMLIATSAAIALAQIALTRRPAKLVRPGALTGFALATLSQMSVIAILSAWVTVLDRIVSRSNKARIFLMAIVIAALALTVPSVRDRLVNRNTREVQADGIARNSADIRWTIFETAWDGFRASPLIGLGYFQFIEYSNSNPEIRIPTGGAGYPTHNTYMEVLVEGGIVTFACLLLHWWATLRGFWAAIRRAVHDRDPLVASCLVGVPIVLVCAALANVLLAYSFWMVCGLATATLNVLRREQVQRPGPSS